MPTIGSNIKLEFDANGIRTVVSYRTNEDGKKVKVTAKVRTNVVHVQVNPAVARRRQLKKFGDSAGLKPGIDSNSTLFGEKVVLKLTSTGKGLEDTAPTEADLMKEKLGQTKILCRICKGDHWTTKCPFKDSHQPLDAAGEKDAEPAAVPRLSSGRYVPPGARGGARSSGADDTGGSKRDDYYTLRITNLSEDATEPDIKDLVSRFGPTARVFVARDRETNVCKGFAFVSFYSREDANRCMSALSGYGYDNLILHVEFAKNKERD
ncbi:eukaryotic translation initiation factor 3 subunit G-domain-containing protein [Zopfochytrium polystomum]|nr:eukaryotic translation initiation factor 3 subunit G-domain-containing protein [Zopfochytrium polystomum]